MSVLDIKMVERSLSDTMREQRFIQWVCTPSRIWRRKQEQSIVSSEWYLLIQILLMSIWRISKRSRSDREFSRRSKVFEIALN